MIRFLFSQKFYIKKRLSYLPYLDYASRNTKQIILYGMKWAITCLWSGKQDAIFSCCWCIRCLWRQICVYVFMYVCECVHVGYKNFLALLICLACSVLIFLSSFLVFSCRWNLFCSFFFSLCFLYHLLLLSSISKFKQPMTYIWKGRRKEKRGELNIYFCW